jgi:hypothetical protein
MRILAMLMILGIVSAGCERGSSTGPASSGASHSAMPAPVAVVPQTPWAPDALEELLAPIALYPDSLLALIFAASVNSQEVLDGGNWLLQHQHLSGEALDSAATSAGFGPSMRALFQFPSVVDMLCQQIDWTRQLGAAFTADQKVVLDAVQRLRAQAVAVGNLQSTPQQTVERKTEGEAVVIEVKPAVPLVVYVPQYDPQAVYAPAPAAPAATTTTDEDTVSTGAAIAGGLLAFGVGVALGKALEDDDNYPYPSWGAGAVYYGPRPFYPPAYVYRPVYGPGHQPALHYASPRGYRHAYNNVTVNRNVVVNNDRYFNRFTNNEWKGRKTYAGARESRTAPPAARDQARTMRADGSAGAEPQQRAPRETANAREQRGRPTASSAGSVSSTSNARGAGSANSAGRARDANAERERPAPRNATDASPSSEPRPSPSGGAGAQAPASRETAREGVGRDDRAEFERAGRERERTNAGRREQRDSRRR